MARKLSKKQEKFIAEYVLTGNGKLAAMASYKVKNENVARSIASENLTKPAIIEEINAKKLDIAEFIKEKAEMAAKVVVEIAQYGEDDKVKIAQRSRKYGRLKENNLRRLGSFPWKVSVISVAKLSLLRELLSDFVTVF